MFSVCYNPGNNKYFISFRGNSEHVTFNDVVALFGLEVAVAAIDAAGHYVDVIDADERPGRVICGAE